MKPIESKIYDIRKQKVMLDFDLALLYEVETKILNQAIKRNIQSFPEDFMFRLTAKEWQEVLSSQILMIGEDVANRSQFVTGSQKHRSKSSLPYAFTEHGVTMLASVLRSSKARQMNIAIVRAFISLRKFALQYGDLLKEIEDIKDRVGNQDIQLKQIYDVIESLLAENNRQNTEKETWKKRERIGFKKQL